MAPTVFEPLLAAGVLDQDPSHRLGGGGEEVPLTGKRLAVPHQAKVGLMNKRRGRERLTGPFEGQPLRGELAELVVDQRQQCIGVSQPAWPKPFQNARNLSLRLVVADETVLHDRGRESWM